MLWHSSSSKKDPDKYVDAFVGWSVSFKTPINDSSVRVCIWFLQLQIYKEEMNRKQKNEWTNV